MAIDLGSGNTTRYYSVPDHADFSLPNGNWTWLALVYPQDSASTKYVISTGGFGLANSFNLYLYNSSVAEGWAARVDSLTEANIAGTPVMNTWHWVYATRRGSNYYVGAAPLGGSAAESAGIPISIGYNSATGPNLGRRSDGTADRHWKGRFGQTAFIPGVGMTTVQLDELSRGAPLLGMPFASNIKFLFHGQNAAPTIASLISGHVATRQGTSYGANEEDIQTPYIWTPEYRRALVSASSDTVGSSSGAATVSGVGASIAESAGSSSGSATVSGVGDFTAGSGSSGSASGVSTVNGVGASTAASSGSSGGVATVTGIGAILAASTGSANGSATVSGVGDSSIPGSTVGTSSGAATVSGVGASAVSSVGVASGSATVLGVSESPEQSHGGDDYPYVIVEKRKKRTHRNIGEIFEDAVKEVFGEEPKKPALLPATKFNEAKELVKENRSSLTYPSPADLSAVIEEEAEKVSKLLAQYQEQARLAEMEEDEELLMLIAMEML